MQQGSEIMKNAEILCGGGDFEGLPALKALPPFDETVCAFLGELSSALMKTPEAKQYPDVVTFGFFCRRANIGKLAENRGSSMENRLGKGVTFHIAPSNVPINFAYSLAAALLAGNACIVRASSKPFGQVDTVCRCINGALEKYPSLKAYVNVLRYPRSEEINAYLSSVCDVRIIWGGDNTISEIRKAALPPRSTEITFADRYSAAVIGAEAVLAYENMGRLAQDFYNDTYLYDQNACSSPRLIYWLGSRVSCEKAAEKFWNAVHSFIREKYELAPVVAVDKYAASVRMAIDFGADIRFGEDNLISRIRTDSLSEKFPGYRCAGGSFIEYYDETFDAFAKLTDRKFQTLSYFGVDKDFLRDFVISRGLSGTDRIVPVGKTADFSLIWDGYDLISLMSRVIGVQ